MAIKQASRRWRREILISTQILTSSITGSPTEFRGLTTSTQSGTSGAFPNTRFTTPAGSLPAPGAEDKPQNEQPSMSNARAAIAASPALGQATRMARRLCGNQ